MTYRYIYFIQYLDIFLGSAEGERFVLSCSAGLPAVPRDVNEADLTGPAEARGAPISFSSD